MKVAFKEDQQTCTSSTKNIKETSTSTSRSKIVTKAMRKQCPEVPIKYDILEVPIKDDVVEGTRTDIEV